MVVMIAQVRLIDGAKLFGSFFIKKNIFFFKLWKQVATTITVCNTFLVYIPTS